MKISLLQNDIVWGNPAANQEKISEILWGLDKSDLYVLPEMFSTGFAVNPEGIAEKDESSLTWMKNMAAELKGAICGSVATEVEGRFYNRLYFVKPNGEVISYDKRHLFTYADEHLRYTRGNERVVVEFRGCRFLLQVCYDLRFPCWSRYSDALNYDVIVLVANWPETRQSAWQLLTRARALENQSYLVACNRVGEDQHCHYAGCSVIVDAYGKAQAQCHKNAVESLTVTLDLQEQQRRRTKFRVLDDRDIL